MRLSKFKNVERIITIIIYNIIISGQILLVELAEKLWRDLAAVPASCICEPTTRQYSTSSQSDSVCVWQAEAINKTNKWKRKNVEDYGEWAQIYFTESACCVFFLASSFCKIDVKLNSSPSSCVLLLYNLHFSHFYIYFLLLFSTHTWTLTTSINYSCSLDNSIL